MSNMSVYYRSTLYGTAVQRIVSGAFAGPRQCNVCLFKGHSIEFMQLVTSPRDPFVSRFEQPVFGTIYDAQRLTCQFNNDDHPPAINSRQGEIEEELYCQNTRPHTPVSGDDVLVMLSEYNKLVFSTVVGHDLERLGRFETLVEVPLDEPGPEYTKMGRKLAVDPCSRALATASYRDRIDVFILHDTMSRAYFHPISGMGSIVEDGIIWHMEFLHTTSESKDRILLATVVFNDIDRTCRLIMYAIDASGPMISIERIGRLPLGQSTSISMPLHLIPVPNQPETCALVLEHTVCLITADDVACGNVLYAKSQPHPMCPLFTAYSTCRPEQGSHIYLGSTEGFLYQLTCTSEMTWSAPVQIHSVAALCVLGPFHMPDIGVVDLVVYAGESADGAVLAVPRTDPANYSILQNLTNRAPIVDAQTTSHGWLDKHLDAVLAAGGHGKQASLLSFAKGVEATLIQTSDAEWHGISQLWHLGLAEDRSLIVATSALDTKVMLVQEGALVDWTGASGFATGVETLLAECLDATHAVQVTHDQVSIIKLMSQGGIEQVTWRPSEDQQDCQITLACACASGMAVCLAGTETNKIVLLEFGYDDAGTHIQPQLDTALPMADFNEPTCMCFLRMDGIDWLVIGTQNPSLFMVPIQSNDASVTLLLHEVPHSLGVICQPDYLLAGLCDGSLVAYRTKDLLKEAEPVIQRVSDLPVRIESTSCAQSSLLLFADTLIKVHYDALRDTLAFDPVLIYPCPDSVDAVASIDTLGVTALVTEGYLKLYALQSASRTNAARMPVGESPRKMWLDREKNHVILASLDRRGQHIRNTVHAIRLDCHEDSVGVRGKSKILLNHRHFESSNVITAMTGWEVAQEDGQIHRYLCLGTLQVRERANPAQVNDRGTLLFYRIMDLPDSYAVHLVHTHKQIPGGVYAICQHPAGLLFSSGSTLHLCRLDHQRKKLVELARQSLRFLISSVCVLGETICVSTATHSATFYRFNEETKKFEYLKSDTMARTLLSSYLVNDHFAIGSLRNGGLVGLYNNPDDTSFERRLHKGFSFSYPDILVKPRLASLGRGPIKSTLFEPWTGTQSDPILGATMAGGLVIVQRISTTLYNFLKAVQERVLAYRSSAACLIGSAADVRRRQAAKGDANAISGDMLSLFLRFSAEEQTAILAQAPDELEELKAKLGTSESLESFTQRLLYDLEACT